MQPGIIFLKVILRRMPQAYRLVIKDIKFILGLIKIALEFLIIV